MSQEMRKLNRIKIAYTKEDVQRLAAEGYVPVSAAASPERKGSKVQQVAADPEQEDGKVQQSAADPVPDGGKAEQAAADPEQKGDKTEQPKADKGGKKK